MATDEGHLEHLHAIGSNCDCTLTEIRLECISVSAWRQGCLGGNCAGALACDGGNRRTFVQHGRRLQRRNSSRKRNRPEAGLTCEPTFKRQRSAGAQHPLALPADSCAAERHVKQPAAQKIAEPESTMGGNPDSATGRGGGPSHSRGRSETRGAGRSTCVTRSQSTGGWEHDIGGGGRRTRSQSAVAMAPAGQGAGADQRRRRHAQHQPVRGCGAFFGPQWRQGNTAGRRRSTSSAQAIKQQQGGAASCFER